MVLTLRVQDCYLSVHLYIHNSSVCVLTLTVKSSYTAEPIWFFFFCNLMIVMVVDGSKFYDLEISPMIWQKEYLQYL